MSNQFVKAQEQAAVGKSRAACESLYYAVPQAIEAGDFAELQAILGLCGTLSKQSDRRVQEDTQEIARIVREGLDRQAGPSMELLQSALVALPGCRVIGGAGIPMQPDATRQWALVFTDDRIFLAPNGVNWEEEVLEIGWDSLQLAVEGAGAIQQGGGFVGGGFGLTGMAVGMLAAGALNALTTSTLMDTVLHLQTTKLELYLFYGTESPEALRRRLSPVFLKIRQAATPAAAPTSQGHVVDRLHKLADLLDRGLISESEFESLKANLLQGS